MEKSIQKKYIFSNSMLKKLIIPLIIEQFLAVAVGMADSIMIASVGETAVSAISLVDSVNILLINIFAALATGGAVVAGQYIGREDNDKARKSGEQLLVFVASISVIIMAIMYFGRTFILNVVFGKIEPAVAAYANTYMLIVFASIPFIAIYSSGAALFRAMGNSKVTMITSIVMNVINIIGNAICIYGLKMGVEGVAIPTLVSRAVAAIMIVILLKNKSLIIHITKPFNYKLDKTMVRKILSIGIPNGVENSMFQLGKILLLSIVAGRGTTSITANAVANAVTSFQILPGLSVSLALVTVVSQCVGAGEYQQARYYTKKLLKYTYVFMICLNIVIILGLPFIVDMYHLSAETASMAKQVIIFYGIFACLMWPISFTLPNTLRAANDVRYTMIVGVGSMWIFRIGFGILLTKYMNFGMFGVWVAMFIDWIVRSILFVIRYKGNKWEKNFI